MSLTRHWFQYHEITLPPVKEEDGKVIRNKKGIKKKKPKKAYEIQSGIHPSQGISLRVSLQLQSVISTSLSSLPNLAVFSSLADPY